MDKEGRNNVLFQEKEYYCQGCEVYFTVVSGEFRMVKYCPFCGSFLDRHEKKQEDGEIK